MSEFNRAELIEKYLDGTLSREEQLLFDKALTDEQFRKDLMFQAQLLDQLNELESQELLSRIKSNTTDSPADKPKATIRFLPQALKISAAVLLLLSALYFLNPFGAADYTKQINEYMIDYPVSIIERGEGTNEKTSSQSSDVLLKEALKAYANNDYVLAVDKFNKLQSEAEKIQLNHACALIRTNKSNEAINILRPLCASAVTSIADNANWYLAIAYLQNNELQRSIDLLNEISKSENSIWSTQAKGLLTEVM